MKHTFTIDADAIRHNTLKSLQIAGSFGLAMAVFMFAIDDTKINNTLWVLPCLLITAMFTYVGVWSLYEWRNES